MQGFAGHLPLITPPIVWYSGAMTRVKIIVCSLVLLLGAALGADVFPVPQFGYVIDFPEGFSLDDGSDDAAMLLFRHTMLPVEVTVCVHPADSYTSARDALLGSFAALGAKGDVAPVRWRNQNCALARMTMRNAALDGAHEGWSCAMPLSEKKGWLTVLAYAPAEVAYDCEQFLLSVLDSVMTDAGSLREPGIVTTQAFPGGKKETLTLSVAGKKVRTRIDREDEEAARFVIDREWAVFLPFASTPHAFAAWQRFYRLVARDTMGRTKEIAFALHNALLPDAQKADPENPGAALAQMLLTWTQQFPYARASTTADKADLAPIPSVLRGAPSDCDSRSLLAAVLLRQMDMEACLFVSAAYSHAMFGVALPGKLGQTISVGDTDYLVGETTATGLTLGMMDAAMQDRDQWLPVLFYD